MKRIPRAILIITCALYCIRLSAQNPELSTSEKHAIRAFVNDLKYGRKELVAAAMHYPMEREYPLMPIMSEKEFIDHYEEFIDAPFIESVKSAEWKRIGWRGICCGSGILWGDVDDNGEFYAYSYWLNQKGQRVWKEAVERQRKKLYPGLKAFKEPVFMFKTAKYIIRVDLMTDDTYRYASWRQDNVISSKPDLIIYGGVLNVEGTLHEKYYSFTNGDYEYEIGPGSCSQNSDFELTVSKKGNILITQQGKLIY